MRYFVVADDLTGANDTGNAFARRGHRTVVAFERDGDSGVDASADSEDVSADSADSSSDSTEASSRSTDVTHDPTDADVAVANTDSRYVDRATAARRVENAVAEAPERTVYKKIDSTLRGNLVAEIDAAVAAADADVAIVAPAFPAADRITVGGYHLVDGTPVSETPAGRDPNGPGTAHLPTLLEGSRYPVVHVPLERVDGADELEATLSEVADSHDGVLAVFDATTAAHLDAVAVAASAASADVAYVGSAGLAEYVRFGADATVLGVVGSVAPETVAQLEAIPDDRLVRLDPERAIVDSERAVADAVDALGDLFRVVDWAVVASATDRADVETALEAGRDVGLDERAVGGRIAEALGAVALETHRERRLDGLFATGGEVATAAADALGAEGLALTGRQLEPGVPLGRIEGGEAAGTPYLTKAGAFGGDTTILNALGLLATYDE